MNNTNDALLTKLLQSKKYGSICPDTVARIYADCQKRYKKPKDAEKAAREKLHGITGAFLSVEDAAKCRAALRDWREDGRTDAALSRALGFHSSTRERLPLPETDAVYARIFEIAGRPARVLDLACGINPLYLGARGIEALGIDISGAAVDLINAAAADCALPIRAVCADLLSPGALPEEDFDLALVFKALMLIERERAGAARELLAKLRARYIAASFPTRTLGGRSIGMAENYAAWMAAQLPENRVIAGSFQIENELYYILKSVDL